MITKRFIGYLGFRSCTDFFGLFLSDKVERFIEIYLVFLGKKVGAERNGKRAIWKLCSMPLAFGILLVLPLVGAIHRSNEILGFMENRTNMSYGEERRDYDGFFVTKILPDREIRRVIRWKGICAKETIVDWGDTNVALREVLLKDSRRKLQLIYEGETLTDCIDESLKKEDEENCSIELQSNDSNSVETKIEVFNVEEKNDAAIREIAWISSTRELRNRCSNVKSKARNRLMAERRHRRIERSLQQMVIAPGTKWCGPHRTANVYKELGALDHADRCCRRHDHCYRAIPPFSERYNLWNYMPFTLSHCGCDQRNYGFSKDNLVEILTRKKRQRIRGSRSRNRRELLLIPGTQWCGRGNRATKYTNLGGFGKADACCRRHDVACPFYIPAFESRYGLFNWGISTIMHCTCDERFRTCLKMARTSSANFIGRIFFNVVQTKCFVLKPQKVCTKQSWWGKCEKYEYRKQAHLRDNVPY